MLTTDRPVTRYPHAIDLEDGFSLCLHSADCGEIRRPLKRQAKDGSTHRIQSAYFGFATFTEAQRFALQTRAAFPTAMIEVRSAKRLATAFEVKLCGLRVADFDKFMTEFVRQMYVNKARQVVAEVAANRKSVQPAPQVNRDAYTLASRSAGTTVKTRSGALVSID